MAKYIKSYRPLMTGQNRAFATNHPQATLVGMDVLRSGGNAAAAAVSLALGVVEPCTSGLGGDGFHHVWNAKKKYSTPSTNGRECENEPAIAIGSPLRLRASRASIAPHADHCPFRMGAPRRSNSVDTPLSRIMGTLF